MCATSDEGPEPVVVGDAYVGDDGAVSFDVASAQDKAFWVTNGSTSFFVPTAYGAYKTSTGIRCAGNLSSWPADCRIPQNRHLNLLIDAESCEDVDVGYSWTVVDAAIEWQEYMRDFHGWDVTVGAPLSQHQPNAVFECDDLTSENALGMLTRFYSECWNLPGYPKDLCLGAQSGPSGSAMVIEIDLAAILLKTFDPLKRHPLIRNIVWHELGHAAGLGHTPTYDSTRIMDNGGVFTHMMAGYMSYHSTWELPALSNFSRTGNACNWQPGDAVGDSCPSQ